MSLYRIGILEDHPATAAGIKAQLSINPALEVVWIEHHFDSVEPWLENGAPDFLILDISVPMNANDPEPYPIFDVLPSFLSRFPDLKIMVFSMHNRAALFKAITAAGAHGYILKEDGDSFKRLDQIVIEILTTGSRYFSPQVQAVLSDGAEVPTLTLRQNEILTMILHDPDLTNKQLADLLVVAPSTIRNHLSIIYTKLGVSNRASAILKAQELGLVRPKPENRPKLPSETD